MNPEIKNALESFQNKSLFQICSDQEIQARQEQKRAIEQSKITETILAKSGIPLRHSQLQQFQGTRWIEKQAELKEKIGTGMNIGLIGPRGTGKTQLAVSLAIEAARRQMTVMYRSAMDIILEIKDSWALKKSERSAIDIHEKPRLLIIDEFQVRSGSDWEDSKIAHIIDKRYAGLKDTILIANLTKDEFLKSVGDSVASRMSETGAVVTCDWPSFRNKQQWKI